MIEDVLLYEGIFMIFLKKESWLKNTKNYAISHSGHVERAKALKDERSFLVFETSYF